MIGLGTLGGSDTLGSGINDLGQVVGTSLTTGNTSEAAFLYTPGIGMQNLGTLGGSYSEGFGINNSGQVTGYSVTAGSARSNAFLYTPGIGMQNLGTLGGSYSEGFGINNSGQVTGTSTISGDTTSHAFIFTPGAGMQDIGSLGGSYSVGNSINNSGQVTGSSYTTGDATTHAFIYTPGKGTIDIGTLGGSYIYSYGNGINNSGQVVGYCESTTGPTLAFLYSGEKMINLNTLLSPSSGWTLEDATGINNLGQIAGWGMINGEIHAFVMTPPFLKVTIDIDPWFKPNIIDIMLKWVPIPVAILSTPSFNAPKSIEWDSLTFGHSGNEKSLAFCLPMPIDVNGDKIPDLICFFNTGEAAFQCGDTQGILKGQTKDGNPIQGSDSVTIVPCK
jgi:probable HAF family extracellular repeat protein